ncbi:MAG: GDP-mannose 4,6-dehydratase [Pseudomonadota bacterium]
MQKALITGITGQDGSYLAEFLISKGYEVHGIIRRASTFNTNRIDHIYVDPHKQNRNLFLHYGDLSDPGLITELISKIQPNEIYHLGAQSHVRVSFDMPEFTGNITGLATTRILEAIRRSGAKSKLYQASSSEMFGASPPPQNENTVFYPRSPYAAAKIYSYWMVVNYREAYDIFACNGILFNHESPRRGETFVTRKITRAVAHIIAGDQQKIFLGNMDSKRDWGFAPDYIEQMWLMLQQDTPDDYVVGTGESHSVRDFVTTAFKYCGVDIRFEGKNEAEQGIISGINESILNKINPKHSLQVGSVILEIDPRYFRPTEVDYLMADISKSKEKLGWEPKVKFHELVKIMVDYDIKTLRMQPIGEGINVSKDKGFHYTNHDFALYENIQENC